MAPIVNDREWFKWVWLIFIHLNCWDILPGLYFSIHLFSVEEGKGWKASDFIFGRKLVYSFVVYGSVAELWLAQNEKLF